MSAARNSGVVIGRSLGNYRVVSLLGRGGMGAVYEGEHAVLGRKAAIKVMLPEYSHNADLVDRFFQEARATARLRHHAFVEVFDSGTLPDGSAYLVMELLEGESLGAHLVRRGALPLGEALTIARHIAEGVGHAHRNGIVHRDLKPDNVFLARGFDPERPGRIGVKVLDFGIAKLSGLGGEPGSGSRTRTGTLMGTPLFMAPEQCRGAGRVVIDHRADIYALGCIVHAMLCAQPPFPYEGVGEIIAAHIGQPPPALGTLVGGVPQAVEALVLRMLAKNVDARPASMDEVIQELQRMSALPGVRPVDLSSIPVAVSSAVRPPDDGRAAAETDVPIVEATGNVSGPRLETRPMPLSMPPSTAQSRPPSNPPAVPVGGTKWLQPAKSISTLSEATGAQSFVTAQTRRPGKGRGVALAVAAVAVVAGGLFVFRAEIWEPVRPARQRNVTPASVGTTEPSGAADDRRARDIAPSPSEDPSPATRARAHVPPPEPPAAADRPSRAQPAGVARDVKIRISSTPSGADIVDAATGARIGQTPYQTSVPAEPRTARYTVQKSDYKSRDVTVKFDADASLDVVLRRKSSSGSSSSSTTTPKPARPAPSDDGDDERRKL